MKTLTKEEWIEEVYALLCKSQGPPESAAEVKNFRDWAGMIHDQAHADAADCGIVIMSPQEAHDEELASA